MVGNCPHTGGNFPLSLKTLGGINGRVTIDLDSAL